MTTNERGSQHGLVSAGLQEGVCVGAGGESTQVLLPSPVAYLGEGGVFNLLLSSGILTHQPNLLNLGCGLLGGGSEG